LSIGSPDAQGRQAPLQPADDLLGDGLLDEQSASGATDLALVEEDPVDDALDGLVERGVVEDDVRRLAAELEGGLLAGARDRAGDHLADRGRAGEGDLVDAGVVDDGLPGGPAPVTMLTTPGGSSACWQISAKSRPSGEWSRPA
jgi:hypothetical protein